MSHKKISPHDLAVHITVACIIVRRLLISLNKWQFPGMADTHEYWSQHDAHLVYLPIFHGLNLIIFSLNGKTKIHRNFQQGLVQPPVD